VISASSCDLLLHVLLHVTFDYILAAIWALWWSHGRPRVISDGARRGYVQPPQKKKPVFDGVSFSRCHLTSEKLRAQLPVSLPGRSRRSRYQFIEFTEFVSVFLPSRLEQGGAGADAHAHVMSELAGCFEEQQNGLVHLARFVKQRGLSCCSTSAQN
jgi:hypothetical protein